MLMLMLMVLLRSVPANIEEQSSIVRDLCTCASSSIPQQGILLHSPILSSHGWYVLLLFYTAVEEFCDNAVIYFIAPSLPLVWAKLLYVAACPFPSLIVAASMSSRWILVNKPLFIWVKCFCHVTVSLTRGFSFESTATIQSYNNGQFLIFLLLCLSPKLWITEIWEEFLFLFMLPVVSLSFSFASGLIIFFFCQWSLYLFLLPVVQPLDQFWPPVTRRVSSTHFPPLKWGFLLPSPHNLILINLSPSLSPSPSKTPSPSHHHHRHHCYHHHHCTHLYREREGVSPVGGDELTVNPAVHGNSSLSSHAVA